MNKGERTRHRILEAALPLFGAHGFAGCSTRMIAEKAGINIATLAYHFESKEGLYLTVISGLYKELEAGFPAPEMGADPIETWAVASWRFAVAHRPHIRLVFRHMLDKGRHVDPVVDTWTGPLFERVEVLISTLRPSWTVHERRLLVLSMTHLIVRFALEDPQQLAMMVGDPDDLDGAIVEWITAMLRRELGVE